MKLTVLNTAIRQNEQGLYSLNDLHQASGGAKKHTPSRWLRYSQAKELIAALEKRQANKPFKGLIDKPYLGFIEIKQNSGAWVSWQLVYAYAMWISAEFNLKVIETFHALQTRPRIQHEKAIEAKHPFYPVLRAQVLEGKKDREIAPVIGRSPASAGYHRKKQFKEGYTDPVEATYNRYAPATARKVIVKRGYDQWGSNFDSPQFDLKFD